MKPRSPSKPAHYRNQLEGCACLLPTHERKFRLRVRRQSDLDARLVGHRELVEQVGAGPVTSVDGQFFDVTHRVDCKDRPVIVFG